MPKTMKSADQLPSGTDRKGIQKSNPASKKNAVKAPKFSKAEGQQDRGQQDRGQQDKKRPKDPQPEQKQKQTQGVKGGRVKGQRVKSQRGESRDLIDQKTLQNGFKSSLVDTVKVKFELTAKQHQALLESNLKHDGAVYVVPGPYPKCSATIFARGTTRSVYVEGSPKYLTGQNLIGTENVAQFASQLLLAVLQRAGLNVGPKTRARIDQLDFELMRVDSAAHCDCRTEAAARTVMVALRRLAVASVREVALYGFDESIYIGLRSSRSTLKIYRKGAELQHNPIAAGVPGAQQLAQLAIGLVRFEYVLRSSELKRLGLHKPEKWQPNTGRDLLQRHFDQATRAQGQVPNVHHIDRLTPTLQLKLRAWLLGDMNAFLGSPTTAASSRRQVLDVTGIDVGSPLSAAAQRAAVLQVRDVLAAGFGFRTHPEAWARLLNGAPVSADCDDAVAAKPLALPSVDKPARRRSTSHTDR